MAHRALVIDDDKATLDLMEFQLKAEGFLVTTAENGQQGLKFIEDDEFDIILTDLQLPGISGIEIVKRSKELSPETEIIMVTGYGSTEKAIEATKAGAFYYVEKPVEFDELIILIGKAIERKQQKAEIRELRGKLSKRNAYEGIIGGSRSMQDIYELIDSVAVSDANILILGESGTGKELIANAIHYTSARSKKPFRLLPGARHGGTHRPARRRRPRRAPQDAGLPLRARGTADAAPADRLVPAAQRLSRFPGRSD